MNATIHLDGICG
jgi:hypothetical protein